MTQASDLPTLSSKRITLRAPVQSDGDQRFGLGNTIEIHRMFGGDPDNFKPITRDQAASWIENQMAEDYSWVIEHNARMIGSVRLHSLNLVDQRASLAIGILDLSLLGKGLGSEAMNLLVSHAFSAMKLHRLTLRVLSFNERAIAAYKKIGFVHEGLERQSARIGDNWHDDVIMGLLAPEYSGVGVA